MKKLIINSVLVLSMIVIPIFFTACNKDQNEDNIVTYYHYEPQVSTISSFIYDYNKKYGHTEYKINVVEFDNIEKMTSQLTTEIMAGKGPDIISLGELEMLSSSTEKLIKQGAFANIDDIISNDSTEDKLELSDYNSDIFDSGVYEGKRYYIPVVFEPQILLSSSDKLSNYLSTAETGLTYENITKLNSNILDEDTNNELFYGLEDYKNVFLNCIDEHVDFYSQKHDFNSEDFMKSIISLKELYSRNEKNGDKTASVFSATGQFQLYALYDEIAVIENDGDIPLITNVPNQDGVPTGMIMDAVFINNNSNNKQKILHFIKYVLSEKVQSDLCGASIEEYLPDTSWGSGWEYPVNNQSYDSLFDKAQEVKYIGNTANISEANFIYAKDYIDNIRDYKLYGLYDHYNTEVIGSIVDQFLSGEIDENKFLNELSSKTEIYLNE